MEFTETQQEILTNAWALAQIGNGQVVEEWAVADAERLVEAGWLERQPLDNGDTAYWWTQEAETALDMNALTDSVEGRHN